MHEINEEGSQKNGSVCNPWILERSAKVRMQPLDMGSCSFALIMKENRSEESAAHHQQSGNVRKV